MTETKNNAKLIKRIVKKIGKTNLLEFFSVSADNLSKVDKKKIQESLCNYAVCFLMDWFCEWVKASTVLHNLTSCLAPLLFLYDSAMMIKIVG